MNAKPKALLTAATLWMASFLLATAGDRTVDLVKHWQSGQDPVAANATLRAYDQYHSEDNHHLTIEEDVRMQTAGKATSLVQVRHHAMLNHRNQGGYLYGTVKAFGKTLLSASQLLHTPEIRHAYGLPPVVKTQTFSHLRVRLMGQTFTCRQTVSLSIDTAARFERQSLGQKERKWWSRLRSFNTLYVSMWGESSNGGLLANPWITFGWFPHTVEPRTKASLLGLRNDVILDSFLESDFKPVSPRDVWQSARLKSDFMPAHGTAKFWPQSLTTYTTRPKPIYVDYGERTRWQEHVESSGSQWVGRFYPIVSSPNIQSVTTQQAAIETNEAVSSPLKSSPTFSRFMISAR
jgi:hypothetical protein